MSEHRNSVPRTVLPIPDSQPIGLTTYDAKDPDTQYPPIEQAAPAEGRAQRIGHLDRRCRLWRIERVRRPLSDAECGTSRGRRPEIQPLPHDGALLADAPGALDGAQPSFGRHGRYHRDRDGGAGLQLGAAEYLLAARADPQVERLCDRAVRQVSRGPGVADEPGRSVRCLADRRRRIRVLLRLHRRRGAPMVPVALRRHDADRGEEDARRGLSLHGRHDRQGDRLDRPAEGIDARQAVLHLLRAGRHARAAPRAEGMGRQVQGQVRQGLGQAARGDLRAPEEARRHSGRLRAHAAAQANSGVGRNAGRPEARATPPDGGLCRLPGVRGSSCRPPVRRSREARPVSTTR